MKLLAKIKKRLIRLFPRKRVARHNGAWFVLDPLNWIDNRILAGQGYEEELISGMLATMRQHQLDTLLDIGANIGYYSVLAAHHMPQLNIHAFEPVRRNLYQIHANLYVNGFEHRVTTYPCALSDAAGRHTIHIDPRSTGISRLSLDHARRDTNVFTQREDITATTLDAVLPVSGQRAFVKIDTEGHELQTLRGMGNYLKNNQCFLQVEISPENEAAVETLLAAAGYKRLHNIRDNVYFSNLAEPAVKAA